MMNMYHEIIIEILHYIRRKNRNCHFNPKYKTTTIDAPDNILDYETGIYTINTIKLL